MPEVKDRGVNIKLEMLGGFSAGVVGTGRCFFLSFIDIDHAYSSLFTYLALISDWVSVGSREDKNADNLSGRRFSGRRCKDISIRRYIGFVQGNDAFFDLLGDIKHSKLCFL